MTDVGTLRLLEKMAKKKQSGRTGSQLGITVQRELSVLTDELPSASNSAAPMTLSKLESHLWEAANILRGPVDAADFKTYVFPLLFFKRISDVRDEEYEAALSESDGDEEYAFVPAELSLSDSGGLPLEDVRKVATNVGQALQKAMRGIEKANPETLYGIFGDAAWTNKDRLPDKLLRDLMEHFSKINLGNQAAEADILGQSYGYLIKKFADATNKKAGEFYTPRSVVRLMVNILDPKEGESIYDPACGTGHAAGSDSSRERKSRRRSDTVGKAVCTGKELDHVGHCSHESVPARSIRLSGRSR
jgi:type I restriction-modification system DNA methylase subunit